MKWVKEAINKNPFLALLLPTGLGGANFIGNLLAALSDGRLDSSEISQLASSASGLETIILIIIMLALRDNKK